MDLITTGTLKRVRNWFQRVRWFIHSVLVATPGCAEVRDESLPQPPTLPLPDPPTTLPNPFTTLTGSYNDDEPRSSSVPNYRFYPPLPPIPEQGGHKATIDSLSAILQDLDTLIAHLSTDMHIHQSMLLARMHSHRSNRTIDHRSTSMVRSLVLTRLWCYRSNEPELVVHPQRT